VDDFIWGKRIGRGAFSEVFIVHHRASGKDRAYAVKVTRKRDILLRKQVKHVIEERAIALDTLSDRPHANIAQHVGAFHDERCVYMVMEFVCGGDLFSHLRRLVRFKKRTVEFYASQVLLVMDHLHDKAGVVYRDLKPENILLDRRGYVKLVDFGVSKRIAKGQRTYTVCGAPEYMAPEIILSKGHSFGVDWWSLGILMYEMIVGQPPFVARSLMDIYKLVVRAKPRFPAKKLRIVDSETKSIIKKLLIAEETRRYGVSHGKSEKIKSHAFFRAMNWEKLRDRKLGMMEGAIVPAVENARDTSQFLKAAKPSSSSKKTSRSVTKSGEGITEEEGGAEKRAKKVFLDQLKSEPLPDVPDSDLFEAFD